MDDSDTHALAESDPRSPSDPRRRRAWSRSPWLWLAVVTVALALAVGVAAMRSPERSGSGTDRVASPTPSPIPPDLDGDGLRNQLELDGWRTKDGATYRTDPRKADTDGDGLSDGQEAGDLVPGDAAESNVYAGYANPLKADTDGDRLRDADEADASTVPSDPDTDNDGLSDAREVQIVGTSPVVADTDGDGFSDGFEVSNRETKGLDPQSVDVRVSKASYVSDFAIGAVFGDAWRKDSLAWLLGNLAATTTSSYIPLVGPIIGSVADVRDLVSSAFRGDWVGSSASAAGVVPVIGDTVAIPIKVGKFVDRNRKLTPQVAAMIVNLDKVPERIKYRSVSRVYPRVGDLRKAGADRGAILRLAKGNTNLDNLVTAIHRKGHVGGSRTPFLTWKAAEAQLEDELRRRTKLIDTQATISTAKCVEVCNRVSRRFDVMANGVAHESKLGFKYLTLDMAKQIESDAFAIKNRDIKGAHWHFYASAHTNKVGADLRLLDYLDKYDIPYTIHMPRA